MHSALLYKDANWLVVNKPTGISTHAAFNGDLGIQEWLSLHWDEKTFVCSRLDKGTSGVLLLARTEAASGVAQQVHEADSATKRYFFLSHVGSLNLGKGKSFSVSAPLDDMPAVTDIELEQQYGKYYLYSAVIKRGRNHQIRRHASLAGIPVLGDSDYGGLAAPRLFLHCGTLEWPGIATIIEAPLPPSFENVKLTGEISSAHVACDRRESLLPSITNAFRLIHRHELPASEIAIDKYGDYLCVWNYSEKNNAREVAETHKNLFSFLEQHYQCKGGVIKTLQRNPHNKRLVEDKLHWGEIPPPYYNITEHGVIYNISLTESQHIGLFLDQRDNRRWFLKNSQAARVANLFSFTCSFSVVALLGKAREVFSVDSSKKILEWGNKNLTANFGAPNLQSKFAAEDVRIWLKRRVGKLEQKGHSEAFDLIICDPPTFSTTSQGGEFSITKSWDFLASSCANLLSPQGIALFSTNCQKSDSADFKAALEKYFPQIEERTPPLDFPKSGNDVKFVKHYLVRKQKTKVTNSWCNL